MDNLDPKNSGFIRVNDGEEYGYVELVVCPTENYVREHFAVHCTVRSAGRYGYGMNCLVDLNDLNIDGCQRVEVSNLTVKYSDYPPRRQNNRCTSKCTFQYCSGYQKCDFNVMALRKFHFELKATVGIYDERIKQMELVYSSRRNLIQMYEPKFNVGKVESSVNDVKMILTDEEFYNFLKDCNYDAEVFNAFNEDFSKQSKVIIRNKVLVVVISELVPNHNYLFKSRIRANCRSVIGRWSETQTVPVTTKPGPNIVQEQKEDDGLKIDIRITASCITEN